MAGIKSLKGGAVLTAGQAFTFGSSFVRNVILARMLSKADFGLAVAFAITVTMLELITRMSFSQQLVQSPDGERDDFMSTMHACQILAGLVSSVLIASMALPLAHAFGVPDAVWAFASLALVPAFRAFEHLHSILAKRHLEFSGFVLCEVVPNAVITVAAWPLAKLVPDFRVVVILLVVKTGLRTLMTHFVARRRTYRVHVNRAYLRGIWAFGWPLLLNGLVMFLTQQGDQFLVGSLLSLEQLALYSVAFSLVSVPWFMGSHVASALLLPVLSRAQDDTAVFRRKYSVCLAHVGLAASVMLSPLIVCGGFLIEFFYGPKYAGGGMLTALLGLTCGVRFLRLMPAITALSRADSKNQLVSNLWRGIGFPLALIAAILQSDVLVFAICALIAEIMAAAYSFRRLSSLSGIRLADHAGGPMLMCGSLGLAFVIATLKISWTAPTALMAMAVSVAISIGAARVLIPEALAVLREASSTLLFQIRARAKLA
jgi:O-antigen/teichoic acid export membrane protein